MRRRCLVLTLLAAVLALAGCGSSSSSTSNASSSSSSTPAGGSSSGVPDLTVSAAASLKGGVHGVWRQVHRSLTPASRSPARTFSPPRSSRASSRTCSPPRTRPCRRSCTPRGSSSKPVTFAANKLVLAVPASSKITSIADAEKPGTTIAIGSATVPIGDLHPQGARKARCLLRASRSSATSAPRSPT